MDVRKSLLIVLVIAGIIIGYIGYTLYAPSETVPTPTTPTPTPTPTSTPTITPTTTPTPMPTAPLDWVTAWLWENGESELVGRANSDLCNYLLQTLRRVNLQAKCVFSEEDIQEIKENDKVTELRFRFYEENMTISQWIEPKDRDHIKTDENGYRILENVKYVLFILEDKLDGALEAHILVYSLTRDSWGCWAIQQDDEIDKTWIDEVNKLLSETVPTPTPTPTPVQMISFEEAVGFALKGGEPKWRFSEYDSLGKFEGEPFVTPDGLVEGYLEWRASNGTLYEAEYLSGEIYGEIECFTGVGDTEEYYVWKITLMDGMPTWIDARNGELLSLVPTRVPGVLTFRTAVRVVYAPQKRIEEWRVQEYKRIGDFEFGPYETPDGLVKGHLLWRASNGTLYEVTYLLHIRGKVLYIEAPDDIEEYYVWEITTENKVYYVDTRNGVIRLIKEVGKPEGTLSVSELLENPVYDTEVKIYGKVSLLGELLCPCFELTSDGKKVEVWYDLMVEDDGTERPSVSVEGIENGDWVIVTGELKTEGIHRSLNDFWASNIEKIE